MRVIGLDCASDDSRIGVALGEYQAGIDRVSRVEICSRERTAVTIVAKWLAGATEALVAIDAPLGWPVHSHVP
jgi:predicted RNase H-like nuclease